MAVQSAWKLYLVRHLSRSLANLVIGGDASFLQAEAPANCFLTPLIRQSLPATDWRLRIEPGPSSPISSFINFTLRRSPSLVSRHSYSPKHYVEKVRICGTATAFDLCREFIHRPSSLREMLLHGLSHLR